MIEMAGGDYVFADLTDNGNNLSTMNLPLEDFYAGAKDADVLLYNSTIEGVVHTTEELVGPVPRYTPGQRCKCCGNSPGTGR